MDNVKGNETGVLLQTEDGIKLAEKTDATAKRNPKVKTNNDQKNNQ